jgi:alpha-beta hydrolase superfamily lysophospholipase
MIDCREDHFADADGLTLYERSWFPDQSTAALVVVHGMVEHSGRYAPLAEQLAAQGWAVYAMDLRGHGRSGGPRAHVDRFDRFLDDLEILLERVRRREPGKPVFLFGHSMGGAIVTQLAVERSPNIQGMVLSAPALSVGNEVFPVLRRAAGFFSRFLPRLRFVRLGTRFLSRDQQVVAEFRADPLVFHKRFTVRIGAEVLRAGRRLCANLKSVRVPFLVMHGTDDRCTDPEASRRLYQEADSPDKTLCLYRGLWHDLLNEPEREQVRADVIRWLNGRRSLAIAGEGPRAADRASATPHEAGAEG